MELSDIKNLIPTQRVKYDPGYEGSKVEYGYVSSVNDTFVFVKFEEQLKEFGWEGTTSKACNPKHLTVDNTPYEDDTIVKLI